MLYLHKHSISQQIQMMPNMLHLSKFPLPTVLLNWPSSSEFLFISENRVLEKLCTAFFESIQLQIIKCFIYYYLIKLMHCILSSLPSPMENLGSSKDYLLLGRKWVDAVSECFIHFKNRLSSIKSNAQHTAHRAGMTSWELQKPICFNLQQLISPPTVSRTRNQIPSPM